MALRYFVIILGIILLVGALFVFILSHILPTDYTLNHSSDWQKSEHQNIGLSLICTNNICQNSVTFHLTDFLTPGEAPISHEQFFAATRPAEIVQVMSTTGNPKRKVQKPIALPVHAYIGNSEGYKGQIVIRDKGHLYNTTYAFVYDPNHNYYLTVVSPLEIADKIAPLTDKLFSAFEVHTK